MLLDTVYFVKLLLGVIEIKFSNNFSSDIKKMSSTECCCGHNGFVFFWISI